MTIDNSDEIARYDALEAECLAAVNPLNFMAGPDLCDRMQVTYNALCCMVPILALFKRRAHDEMHAFGEATKGHGMSDEVFLKNFDESFGGELYDLLDWIELECRFIREGSAGADEGRRQELYANIVVPFTI